LIKQKENKGVGQARKTGIEKSSSPILLFFDTDIANITSQMMKKVVEPILKDEADFVMAAFENEGRVTELTAKPLLKVCFPELAYLRQPISGQFAAKREFLFPHRIENSMLSILIDAYLAGARITEVDIGLIEHNHHQIDIKKKQAFYACQSCIKRFVEQNNSFSSIFLKKISSSRFENTYQRDEF
jgi:glycosyltransferase involved in cell wall biosynthesis